jgi:hypothetical protein
MASVTSESSDGRLAILLDFYVYLPHSQIPKERAREKKIGALYMSVQSTEKWTSVNPYIVT